METIIEHLKKESISKDSYAEKAAKAGLRYNDYPLITLGAIREYLQGLLKRNEDEDKQFGDFSNKTYKENRCLIISERISIVKTLKKRKILWDKKSRDWYSYFNWKEMPFGLYEGTPPEHILESAIRAKERGYELFVVTVNSGEVEDPLLLGLKEGKRYLVDWWDNDISIDEINLGNASPQST